MPPTRAHGGEILLCGDDRDGDDLGDGLTSITGGALTVVNGRRSLTVDGKTYDVLRDVVGESGANALVAAIGAPLAWGSTAGLASAQILMLGAGLQLFAAEVTRQSGRDAARSG